MNHLQAFVILISREEEIRTLDAVTHILPFQGSPFNHSGTSLSGCKYKEEILVSKSRAKIKCSFLPAMVYQACRCRRRRGFRRRKRTSFW